jgi:hypothetical protein
MSDPRSIWAADDAHLPPLSPAVLRGRADALHRRVRRRNRLEYIAAAPLVPLFGWIGWISGDTLMRIACIVLIAGIALVVWNLSRRGAQPMPEAEALAMPAFAFHRAQLVRQRDALRNVWRWYLAPFVPGMVLFLAAIWHAMRAHQSTAAALVGVVPTAAIVAAVFVGIHFINRAAARRLDREIAALDSLDQED